MFDGHELWLGGSAFELLKHLKRGTGLQDQHSTHAEHEGKRAHDSRPALPMPSVMLQSHARQASMHLTGACAAHASSLRQSASILRQSPSPVRRSHLLLKASGPGRLAIPANRPCLKVCLKHANIKDSVTITRLA